MPGIDLKKVRWAIGGYSLYLDKSYSNASQYYSDILPEGAGSVQHTAYRPRTAIFYIGGGIADENTVLFTAFEDSKVYTTSNPQLSDESSTNGFSLWDLRQCIKSLFPGATTHGVILDGGGSTGITYPNGSTLTAQMVNVGGIARPLFNMVVTPW